MAELSRDNKIKIIRLAVVCASVLLFVFIILTATRIKEIQVEDGNHYTAQDMKERFTAGKLGKNALYVYFKNRYGKQPDIPFVEYVDIELKGINRLRFTVYEKGVVGCIYYMNKYIYFDKDGCFVEQSDEKLEDVTFITGIKFKQIALYEHMETEEDSLFEVIMNLTKLIEENEIEIDKIEFNSTGGVILYSGDIEILLGKRETYDEQIAKLSGLLESAKGMSGIFHMENYDGSSDDIIFNKK